MQAKVYFRQAAEHKKVHNPLLQFKIYWLDSNRKRYNFKSNENYSNGGRSQLDTITHI